MKKRGRPAVILMAEDDPDDRLLSKEALKEVNHSIDLYFVEDGEELIEYLYHNGKFGESKSAPRPELILLDLNMPRKDGREALAEIKSNPDLRRIPVVVLTTSKAEEDIAKSYDLGVSGYITKPVTLDRLIEIMKTLAKYWLETVELPSV